jgi:DNA-binding transcriptional regulator YiaG
MTPAEITKARAHAGHNQTQAGLTVGVSMRCWQNWEGKKRRMPHSAWVLYLLMTGQHETLKIVGKSDGTPV